MKTVTYDTQEKVRAYWKLCDALRKAGINTSDQKVVAAVEEALLHAKELTPTIATYAKELGVDLTQRRDDRDFPLLLTCWHLDEQREVLYAPYMKWSPNIIKFVGNRWYKQQKE